MAQRPTLQFLGAAGTVTGSKHLVRAGGAQVLLDCGLFQGEKALRLRNWQPLPLEPDRIDAVVLSHAHIDHSGALPLLVKQGYRGPIFCTPATADLLAIMLLDSAHLQEEEAEFANRRGYSKHHPALPLYTARDAEHVLRLLEPRVRGARFAVTRGIAAQLHQAGHILGAATVELQIEDPSCVVAFSGDLGRWGRPILRDPELTTDADVVLVESTYGDREHAHDPTAVLADVVSETLARRGIVVVPAFAVGRTQELLWTLRQLEDQGRIPIVPVRLDSPMACSVTEIYARHPEEHDLEMKSLTDARLDPLRTHDFELVRTVADSRALCAQDEPMIVIAGSGMATGGRVLHHLARRLPDARNTVLFNGFQAAGTRGRRLVEGARTLRMHGRDVEVRAQVVAVEGFSAHADRLDLLRWLRGFRRKPRHLFVVHGEPPAAESLRALARAALGWDVAVARDGALVALDA